MNKEEIKEYLLNDPKQIKHVLESLGCSNVKIIKNKYLACNRPDGDNRSAVNVKLNRNLSARIWTRTEFNKYEIQDIYTLIMYIKNIDFPSAIEFVAKTCGLKFDRNTRIKTRSASADFLRKFKRIENIDDNYKEKIIDYKTKDRFVREDCELFLHDGISSEIQEEFEVSFDVIDNRVVFPIKNKNGEIVSFKGRSNDPDYLKKGIPKYMYYSHIDARRYLFGLYENRRYIEECGDCIILEAEKGVMQCCSFEVRNVISTSKKSISEFQVKSILKLGTSVTLAYDKDVSEEEIYRECIKFKGLCDVYYILDKDDLLKGKESPCDKGLEIWNRLYKDYRIKFNGGDFSEI